MKLTSNIDVEKYGIQYIDKFDDILFKDNLLWTSRCSKTKGKNQDIATPKTFYISPLNLLFYRYMEKYSLRYGIISDMYGLHYDDEYLEFYDVHPSTLSQEDKKKLGNMIGKKMIERDYTKTIFYNTSPKLSIPYFEMLLYAKELYNIDIYFITRIKLLDMSKSLFNKGIKK